MTKGAVYLAAWRAVIMCIAVLLAAPAAAQGPAPAATATATDKEIAKRHSLSAEDLKLLKSFPALTPEMSLELPTARVQALLQRLKQPSTTSAVAAALYQAMIRMGGTDVEPPADALAAAIRRTNELANRAADPDARPPGTVVVDGVAVSVAGLPLDRQGLAAPAPILPASRFKSRPAGSASVRTWKWLGPKNIGGRTRALVVHPVDHKIMWAAGVGGGIWKSSDAGASWRSLPGFVPAITVSTMAIDPNDPRTLFAGTGEGFIAGAQDRGLGIFRSTDGGATWTQLPGTAEASDGYVNRITFTSDGRAMLVATRAGLLRSLTFQQQKPEDVQFHQVAQGDGLGFSHVSCSPSDATRCIAGAYRARIMISRDGGANWALATGPAALPPEQGQAGRVELAFAAANPSIIYAGIDVAAGELWRSDDNGATFTRRNTGSRYLGTQGMYASAIWAGDPSLADLVVVGGVDLFRSTDGGTTFARISDWRLAPRSPHSDQHVILAHPAYNGTSNRIVYFSSDGGIYRHDDVLNASPELGWIVLNNGYGVTQFYGVAGNTTSGRVVAGAQDNGVLSYEPPTAAEPAIITPFRTMITGDGAATAADPVDIAVVYGSQAWLWLSRSTTGGLSADPIYEGILDVGSSGNALFVSPIAVDPSEGSRMLAGGASLWQSRDVKAERPTWKEIKPPMAAPGVGKKVPLISAIELRPTASDRKGSDIVWAGHTNGDIFRSFDSLADQPTWTLLTEGQSALPRRMVTRIRVLRQVAGEVPAEGKGIVVATFAGYASDNVWRSDDDGQTWRSLHGSLPNVPVFDVAIHPRDASWMYVATEIGVFASADGGATWTPTGSGPTMTRATQFLWMGERLVVSTFGRGIYWIDLSGVGAETPAPPAPPTPPTPLK